MSNVILFRPQPPRNITFSAMVEEFNTLRRGHVSKTTINRFELASRRLLDYTGSGLLCQNIDKPLIAGYIGFLRQGLDLSNRTINNHLHALSPVIKYGVSRGYIPEDFTIPKV